MPFVKVHISRERMPDDCRLFAEEIRRSMVEVLEAHHDHGHVVVYHTDRQMRCSHEHRDQDFAIVEILMPRGHSREKRESLFRALSNIVQDHTGVPDRDILLNILETDRHDWAVRGGIPMSRVEPE